MNIRQKPFKTMVGIVLPPPLPEPLLEVQLSKIEKNSTSKNSVIGNKIKERNRRSASNSMAKIKKVKVDESECPTTIKSTHKQLGKFRVKSKMLKHVRNNSLIKNIENVQRNWQSNSDNRYAFEYELMSITHLFYRQTSVNLSKSKMNDSKRKTKTLRSTRIMEESSKVKIDSWLQLPSRTLVMKKPNQGIVDKPALKIVNKSSNLMKANKFSRTKLKII